MATSLNLCELAEKFDIDVLHVTTAEPFVEQARRIREQVKSDIVSDTQRWKMADLESFCNPKSVLPSARSIIVGAESYLTSEPEDSSKPGEPHGLIARYTWRNYYLDLRKKLQKLAKSLKGIYRGRFRAYSCGPVAEKPMAQRSGLGFYGKHGIILSKEFGSYIVLGEIITDLEIEHDAPIPDSCGNCRTCIEKCPTAAIVSPYVLNWEKCFQYLTNWPGFIHESYRKLWGKRIYGCTVCQDVCPRNKKVKPKERIPVDGRVGPSFPLIQLLKMSEKEYRVRFKKNQMAAKWIRFDCIRRNAIVALGNSGDPAAFDILVENLSDKEPMIRGHTAWAIGRLADRRGKRFLEKALTIESDDLVKKEIKSALENLLWNIT